MKLIVAGSRSFEDFNYLSETIEANFDVVSLEIVSGGARGTDRLGEEFSRKWGIPLHRFPAEWDKHGRSAGYIRNKEMADFGDALIAFWDGYSKGTGHMIDLATKAGLRVEVIIVDANV